MTPALPPLSSLPLDLVAALALFALGFATERYTRVDAVRRSLPSTPRTVVDALALGGPWLLYFRGLVPGVVVGGSVVALACSLVLWFVLPFVVAPFVGTRETVRC